MHTPYPSFSLLCVQEVIRIVRGGTLKDELALFVKCAYTLTGSFLGTTIGEPGEEHAVGSVETASVDEIKECKDALELVAFQGFVDVDSETLFGNDETAIDPATLALIVQLAIKLISKWLENRS